MMTIDGPPSLLMSPRQRQLLNESKKRHGKGGTNTAATATATKIGSRSTSRTNKHKALNNRVPPLKAARLSKQYEPTPDIPQVDKQAKKQAGESLADKLSAIEQNSAMTDQLARGDIDCQSPELLQRKDEPHVVALSPKQLQDAGRAVLREPSSRTTGALKTLVEWSAGVDIFHALSSKQRLELMKEVRGVKRADQDIVRDPFATERH